MQIVLLNGEKGVGKTTFATSVCANLIFKRQAITIGFKDPLKEMLFGLWQSQFMPTSPEAFERLTEADYIALKKRLIAGKTGREWMIHWGSTMREESPTIFAKLLAMKIHRLESQVEIIIVDDLGFQNELSFMHSFAEVEHHELCMVYLDERATRFYDHGEQFDGDSRFCLVGESDFVNPDLDTFVERLLSRQ